jgi:transcriptional regulator with XRE-family HTH domain
VENLFKKLGARIKLLRENSGLTQEELSETAGISQNFMSQLETGRRSPSLPTINKIASVLNVPIYMFFKFDPEDKPKKIVIKNYDSLISSLNKKEQAFLSDVVKETASKLRKLRK